MATGFTARTHQEDHFMRAVFVSAFGGPEVLTEAELPDPEPGPGQITARYANSATASKASTSGNQWSRCLKWHLAGTRA
jgi:hypothetical protein